MAKMLTTDMILKPMKNETMSLLEKEVHLAHCSRMIGGEMSELARFSTWTLIIAATITIIIMILGLFGNALTIIALIKHDRIRNIAASFIMSLCVADFLFCLLVLPFSASRFINGGWIYGKEHFLCTMFPLLRYWNLGVSLLSIAMITINRYIMITNNSLYLKLYKPLWIGCMIAFCWLFSFAMQVPTLLGIWGKFRYDPLLQTCTIMPDSRGGSSKVALFTIAFVIPCAIIIFCYFKIFWAVHKSENRMRRHSARSDVREAKTRKNEWRITKMVLVIFLSFVCCYLPITIVKVADKCVNYPIMHVVGYILIYLSACVNPIIYVFMNKQYRKAFRAVLCCPTGSFTAPVAFHSNKSKIPRRLQQQEDAQNSQTMVSRVSVTNTNFVIREDLHGGMYAG